MDLLQILLGVVATLIATVPLFAKKINEIKAVLKEADEANDAIRTALQDNNITKEEIAKIQKESNEVWIAVKRLLTEWK